MLPAFEGVRSKEGNGMSDSCRIHLQHTETQSSDFNLTGLSRGGQQVQRCRETYVKAVGTLVELASLQVSHLDNETGRLLTKLLFEL